MMPNLRRFAGSRLGVKTEWLQLTNYFENGVRRISQVVGRESWRVARYLLYGFYLLCSIIST